jgi:nucleoside-diphosphate-sugar epimerase
MTAPEAYRGAKVVVTGGGGFLGSALVCRLENLGAEVVGLSRASGFNLLEDAMPLDGVEHIFHLAAETGVPDSWKHPERFHLVNTHGTIRVMDQARIAGCCVTYVGAYVYGVPQRLPIDELHPVDPNNPYAFSKWMGEQACAWYSEIYKLPVTAIRLFNVYGPGQSDRFLIPRIVGQALNPGYGDIELMDLAPRRDYLYVDDAVEALLLSRPSRGFRIYNVGSGLSHSVSEVVDTVLRCSGTHKRVRVVGEPRPNEIPDVRADCSLLRSETGWRPRYSLEDGIRQVIKESRS